MTEPPVRPPFVLGDYLVVDSLGRGGMGEVYLARHTAHVGAVEKICVLKTIRLDKDDEEHTRRFFDEARVVFQMSHQNICPVYEVGEALGRLFLSMAYVPGLDLAKLGRALDKRGVALSPQLALSMIAEVLEALDYAHRLEDPATGQLLHIVHRDVSPQNVLLSWEGEVLLIDFGLAQSTLKREQTSGGFVLGKRQYMAPEHARGDAVDAAADQFAAGVMLYELLTSKRFYSGLSQDELFQVVGIGGYLPEGMADVDEQLAGVLRRSLAADPADRFPDCHEMARALKAIALERRWALGRGEHRTLVRDHLSDMRDAERGRTRQLMTVTAPSDSEPTQVSVMISTLMPSSDTSSSERSSSDGAAATGAANAGPAADGASRGGVFAPSDNSSDNLHQEQTQLVREVSRPPHVRSVDRPSPSRVRTGLWVGAGLALVATLALLVVVVVISSTPSSEMAGPRGLRPEPSAATGRGGDKPKPTTSEDEDPPTPKADADLHEELELKDEVKLTDIGAGEATKPQAGKRRKTSARKARRRKPTSPAERKPDTSTQPQKKLPPVVDKSPQGLAKWILANCRQARCRQVARSAPDVVFDADPAAVRGLKTELDRCVARCRR